MIDIQKAYVFTRYLLFSGMGYLGITIGDIIFQGYTAMDWLTFLIFSILLATVWYFWNPFNFEKIKEGD